MPVPRDPLIPAIAQSENKSKFLERLGLSAHSEYAKMLYKKMKEEAADGRGRMSNDVDALLPQLRGNHLITQPYSNTQITETAMHRETLFIYRTASPQTRPYYDRGHYVDGVVEDNWVIRWLLWHVFRYRDNRNRGRGVAVWGPDGRGPMRNGRPTRYDSTRPQHSSPLSQQQQTSRYWDPVRDAQNNHAHNDEDEDDEDEDDDEDE